MDKEILKRMRFLIKEGEISLIDKLIKENDGLLGEVTGFGAWLQVAATQGKLDVVEYLVNCGVDINANTGLSDTNAMRQAALNGYIDIMNYLCLNGAILDVSNSMRNPLFAAIYGDHFDAVKFLVENGIDITATYAIGQLDKVDACEYARQFGRTEIYNYLKEKMQ